MEQENNNPGVPEQRTDDGGQANRTFEPNPEPKQVTPPAEAKESTSGTENVSAAQTQRQETQSNGEQSEQKPAQQRGPYNRREFSRNGDRRGFRRQNGENNQQSNTGTPEQSEGQTQPEEKTQGQQPVSVQAENKPAQERRDQAKPQSSEKGLTREQQQQILKDLAAGREITEIRPQGGVKEKPENRVQPIQRAPGQSRPQGQNNQQQQGNNQQQPQGNSQQQGNSPQVRQNNSQQGNTQQGRQTNNQQSKSGNEQTQNTPQPRVRVPQQAPAQQRQIRHPNTPPVTNRRVPQSDNRQQRTDKSSLLNKKISIVIPLYDEEESLQPLTNEIRRALQFSKDYEVIFVDDGSRDNSLKLLKEICANDSRFKYVSFQKNYGKSAALQVGFRYVTGDIVITMDADLQDDPAEVYNLIKKMEEGYDLVSGWKKKRFDPFIKRHSSKFFNFMTRMMSGIKIHDFNCGLKAYKRSVVDTITVYGELHRYMPVLAHWQGFSVGELAVKHHPRKYGKTKFGISRFFKGFVDLLTVVFITRYVKRPMHFFGFFGAGFTLVGFLISLWLSIEKILQGVPLSNRPLLILGTLLITVGIQFFSIGMIGELIVHSTQNDKEYKIKAKGL